MTTVTRNAVLLGFTFNVCGLLKALCDRWQPTLIVQGFPTRIPHAFKHVFFLWFIKQLLQVCMYFVWHAIANNKFGLGCLSHGEVKQRGQETRHVIGGHLRQEVHDPPSPDGGATQSHLQLDRSTEESGSLLNDPMDDTARLLDSVETTASEDRGQDRSHNVPGSRTTRPLRKYTKLLYFPPALFELAHTILLYFGVKLTYGSSFIMLKGTIGFFGALLSMAFLAQPIAVYIWFGTVLTMLGFGALGVSDYVHNTPHGFEKYGIAAGDLLIAMSQIMYATKLIYEEKFLRKHSIHPMRFMGAEGFYGFSFASILLLIFSLVNASQYSELPNSNVEDIRDACWQLAADWRVVVAVLGSVVMFILTNYLGLYLVRDFGALPRMMIELLMWAAFAGLGVGVLDWEQFYIAQVPGFVGLLVGLLVYSHILVMPRLCHVGGADESIGEDLDMLREGLDGEEEPGQGQDGGWSQGQGEHSGQGQDRNLGQGWDATEHVGVGATNGGGVGVNGNSDGENVGDGQDKGSSGSFGVTTEGGAGVNGDVTMLEDVGGRVMEEDNKGDVSMLTA